MKTLKLVGIATVVLTLASACFAASFEEYVQGAWVQISAQSAQMRISAASANAASAARRGSGAAPASYKDFKGLYALWIKDEFRDPADKKLVEKEMRGRLKVSTNRAELAEVRVMLSNERGTISDTINAHIYNMKESCRYLREVDKAGYGNLTDAEILGKVRATNTHTNLTAASAVALQNAAFALEYQKAREGILAGELKLVDARLAELEVAP